MLNKNGWNPTRELPPAPRPAPPEPQPVQPDIAGTDPLGALLEYRESSAVKRLHTVRTIRTQTVGEHSHGVAVLVMLVEPECSAMLLKAALTHDFAERASGDIPSTAKWAYPDLAKAVNAIEEQYERRKGLRWPLTEHEALVLRFCDYLELLMWSYEERGMGNSFAMEVVKNISTALDNSTMPSQRASELYQRVKQYHRTVAGIYV